MIEVKKIDKNWWVLYWMEFWLSANLTGILFELVRNFS